MDVASWILEYENRTFAIGPKPFLIGRGEGCDLVIEDSAVSRRHAVVTLEANGPVIADPGSRHGVQLNGAKLLDRAGLKQGDRIAILEHEITVHDAARVRRAAPTLQQPQHVIARVTLRKESTGEIEPASTLLVRGDDALARGETAAVVKTFDVLLETLRTAEATCGADPGVMRRSAVWMFRSAAALGRADWISAVIALHERRKRVMHALTVDALCAALARVPSFDRAQLAAYVSAVSKTNPPAGSYEAFCLTRLREL